MKEKKYKTIIIVLVVIIVLLLCPLCFILGMNYMKTTLPADEEIKVDESVKADLLVNIEDIYNDYFLGEYPIDVKNLSNQELIGFGMYLAFNERNASLPISSAILDEEVSKYLKDVQIKHANYLCPYDNESLYNYDENTKTYSYNENHGGHGGPGSIAVNKVLYVSDKLDDDTYTISVKIAYGNYCSDTCGPNNAYYATYEDALNGTNAVYGDPTSDNELTLTNTELRKISSSLKTYSFVFTKDNDTYKLVKVLDK